MTSQCNQVASAPSRRSESNLVAAFSGAVDRLGQPAPHALELRAVSKSVEDQFLAPLEPEQRASLHELLLQLTAHHDPRYAPGNGAGLKP